LLRTKISKLETEHKMKDVDDQNEQMKLTNTLKERLNKSWSEGDLNELYGLLDELCKRISSKFVIDFDNITKEDVEDCFGQVMYKILDDIDQLLTTVKDPWSYIWKAVSNEVISLLEETGNQRDCFRDIYHSYPEKNKVGSQNKKRREEGVVIKPLSDNGDITIPLEHATFLIEGLINEIDARSIESIKVVKLALEELTRSERGAIEIILVHGPDYNATHAKEDYNINPSAYRQNKKRAYDKLKLIIPDIFRQIKNTPKIVEEPEIFIDLPSEFPSLEEEN